MKTIGIFLTVVTAVLGAGYYLSSAPGADLVVENPETYQSILTEDNSQEMGGGVAAIDAAKEVRDAIEQKAEEDVKQEIENKEPIPAPKPTAVKNEQEAEESKTFSIKDRLVSFGYAKSSGRTIDTVVLHSSYNNQGGDEYSVDKVIGIWKSYDVAPHYMIDRKGNIFRLVEDKNVAYHAGVSEVPDGRTNVNGFSIGVEILNSLDDNYTDAQYEAVRDLIAYLKGKYKIKYVLGHDDIAPGRKTDPWNFDWKKLK